MAPFSVVICGGGLAGVEGLLRLHKLAGERVEVTLISPAEDLVYRPLTVLEPFATRRADRYSLARIVTDTGAQWVRDSLDWLDRDRRIVHTTGDRHINYDAVLLAVGGRELAPPAHVDIFTGRDRGELYRQILAGVTAGDVNELVFLLPPGPTWPLPLYELALLTAAEAHKQRQEPALSFIVSDAQPLEALGGDADAFMAGLLQDSGITLYTGSQAQVTSRHRLVLQPGGTVLRPDRTISLPVITGPNIRGIPGFARDRFLHVDEYCRVLDTDGRIFAAGDATDLPVKHGSIGTQQADVAAAGIAHLAGIGPSAKPLRPRIDATLFTGAAPLHLSAYLIAGQGWRATFHDQPPWPAEEKVIAAELGPYLRTFNTPAS